MAVNGVACLEENLLDLLSYVHFVGCHGWIDAEERENMTGSSNKKKHQTEMSVEADGLVLVGLSDGSRSDVSF